MKLLIEFLFSHSLPFPPLLLPSMPQNPPDLSPTLSPSLLFSSLSSCSSFLQGRPIFIPHTEKDLGSPLSGDPTISSISGQTLYTHAGYIYQEDFLPHPLAQGPALSLRRDGMMCFHSNPKELESFLFI